MIRGIKNPAQKSSMLAAFIFEYFARQIIIANL
jgi:hypothetical protein